MFDNRNLPALKSREEMLEILQREEYGYLPPKPDAITWEVIPREVMPREIKNFACGNATVEKVIAHCKLGDREFSFPFYAILPTAPGKHPFFAFVNFYDPIPNRYLPAEELVDNGFGVLMVCYKDVTSDDGDFTNGLAGVLYQDGKRGPTDAGKIAMWAWACHRLMDYAETRPELDTARCAVCGHSRLGKTALLAAATDERFPIGYSNDSGCSGAAITRGKQGETAAKIYNKFPFWFCENYEKYGDNEEHMPFDQHYLLASIAPRKVLVGSASEDAWADPVSEQLCCMAASPAFEKGYVGPDRPAEIGEAFMEGDIGYHLRKGSHYFGRADWHRLMEFLNKKV